jgi:predicted nucleotide-binding protein
MAKLTGEFSEISQELIELAGSKSTTLLKSQTDKLDAEARHIERAWSGSALGYHTNVYTYDLRPPTEHDKFSVEWGLMDVYASPTSGYRRYEPEYIKQEILRRAGAIDLNAVTDFIAMANDKLAAAKSAIESILTIEANSLRDEFVKARLSELKQVRPESESAALQAIVPRGSAISRDVEAISGRRRAAPHHELFALTHSFNSARNCLLNAAKIISSLRAHMERREKMKTPHVPSPAPSSVVGKGHVFIGHGRSSQWLLLKDFLKDRLGIPYDEFNRVAVAGVTNVERLSEMLDAASFAFLVMTGEDEMAGGKTQPRMNVVHEAGLFQGRLGFGKAIVLLEDGCEDFSNIDGLGQIRFPKGNIKAAFEDIRRVLEREGLISK